MITLTYVFYLQGKMAQNEKPSSEKINDPRVKAVVDEMKKKGIQNMMNSDLNTVDIKNLLEGENHSLNSSIDQKDQNKMAKSELVKNENDDNYKNPFDIPDDFSEGATQFRRYIMNQICVVEPELKDA